MTKQLLQATAIARLWAGPNLSLWLLCFVLLAVAAWAACSSQYRHHGPKNATASGGMVASAHPLATQAGVAILRAGGNAFDAAVTVAASLGVTEPMMSGIGGYGTILIYDAASGQTRFLNSSSRIPSGVDSDVYREPHLHYMENRRGAKAISTPANVAAWQAMSEEYGRLEWSQLLAEPIRLADEGFEISSQLAFFIGDAFEDFPPHARQIYGDGENPLTTGQRLIQTDLADSLEEIAREKATAVQTGRLARAIASTSQKAGGFLALEDLQRASAEWYEPISIAYGEYRVLTASPPSTAYPSLIRLGLMSQFDLAEMQHNSVPYLHLFAEVTKKAFWDRLAYAGDPEVAPPPLDRLLSQEYWRQRAAEIDRSSAEEFVPPRPGEFQEQHTTHFVVADRWGNIVSATQTLGNAFGSRIMPEGTGIWLNNSLAYSTFEPKGNPMDAHPGRHKLSGDCPTIVMKEQRPRVALGTPGGHTIGQTVPQMVLNLVEFEMSLAEAVAAPRISFVQPQALAVERALPAEIRKGLEAKGHQLRIVRALGNAHAVRLHYEKGKLVRFEGSSDPRGEGSAQGIEP